MNTAIILNYLSQLSRNNNREWFHAHKAEYQEASAEFQELLQALIQGIGQKDSSILHNSPKDLTFKLMRDTRFSHDKSPYNPAFRAHISSMGKAPIPVGYYLMLKPDNQSFLGGGLFADMFKEATAMVRDYIVKYPEKWEQVIQDPDFKKNFKVQGTALKNIPAGYDKEHPLGEYLKNKCWYLEYPVEDSLIQEPDSFLELAEKVFLQMKPFNDLLNQALAEFKMPER